MDVPLLTGFVNTLQFSSLVISGFGFSKFNTMLVGLPSGAIQILTIWTCAFGMRHTKNFRWAWGIFATVIPLIGSILLLCLPASNGWGIVVSTWLAAQSSDLILISLSLIASNIKGNTKKSTVNAMYFVWYSVGCIIGPQLWQSQDAPRYSKGCISSIVSWVLLLACFVGYYIVCRHHNQKRKAMGADEAADEHIGIALDSDMTDSQDTKFKFTL